LFHAQNVFGRTTQASGFAASRNRLGYWDRLLISTLSLPLLRAVGLRRRRGLWWLWWLRWLRCLVRCAEEGPAHSAKARWRFVWLGFDGFFRRLGRGGFGASGSHRKAGNWNLC